MAGLRVFVSSTMGDLANERAETVARIAASNFTPVNAESIAPTGAGSWDRIRGEIESSDVFVLILGSTYGSIPSDGPMSGEGKAVTELEFDEARRRGKPILAFFKVLGYGTDSTSDDARRRDEFRARVESWVDGVFRQQFHLARDLSDAVAESIATLLTHRFRAALNVRAPVVDDVVRPPDPPAVTELVLPEDLVRSVSDGEVIAFFGAGVSLHAGMPSAVALTDQIVQRLRVIDPTYQPPGSGTLFNGVATDLETLGGRSALEETVDAILRPPFALRPTFAHEIGRRLFPRILTTNFDSLLEQTLPSDTASAVIVEDLEGELPETFIMKLHGTVEHPSTLVLTEHDLVSFMSERPNTWAKAIDLLRGSRLLAIGTSLRDPSIVALLDAVGPDLGGWSVQPFASTVERRRLARWNLDVVESTADTFMAVLDLMLCG
jgi:hypothetical protein